MVYPLHPLQPSLLEVPFTRSSSRLPALPAPTSVFQGFSLFLRIFGPREKILSAAGLVHVKPIAVALPMLSSPCRLLLMKFPTLHPPLMSCLAAQQHSTSGLAFKKWIGDTTYSIQHTIWAMELSVSLSPNIEGGQLCFFSQCKWSKHHCHRQLRAS